MHRLRSPLAFAIALFATSLIGSLPGCKVESIEVGSRLEQARDDGTLPEHAPPPALSETSSPADLVQRAITAAQRNLDEASLGSLLDELGLQGPLRDDLAAYLLTMDTADLSPESIAIHSTAFLIGHHDPSEGLRTATEERLMVLGLALALEDQATLANLLVDAPSSRLLHCHHPTEPDLLMSAYATQLVAELKVRGFACRPVSLRR